MKRPPNRLTISVLVLVLTALGLVVSDGIKTHAAGTARPGSRGPSLTIIFRGLMALRQDREEHTLGVGILLAPEHEFTMQVLEKSPQGVSTYSIPANQLMSSNGDTWLAAVADEKSGVTYYQNGVFNRKKGVGDNRDFRWLIDLEGEEFYGRKLATDRQHMGVEVKFSNGEFYAKTTTRPLERRIGDKTFEYFGRVAQEIATDVFLESGDFVLTSQASGKEILRLKQKPDTTYELVFDNSPPPMQHSELGTNHFQYYYEFFPMPKSEWYEFRVIPPAVVQTGLKGRNLNLVEFAHPLRLDEIPCAPLGYGGGNGGG